MLDGNACVGKTIIVLGGYATLYDDPSVYYPDHFSAQLEAIHNDATFGSQTEGIGIYAPVYIPAPELEEINAENNFDFHGPR